MTRTVLKLYLYVSAVPLLAVVCSGCVSSHSYSKRQFVIEAARPAQPVGQRHDVVLAVRGFHH